MTISLPFPSEDGQTQTWVTQFYCRARHAELKLFKVQQSHKIQSIFTSQ